MNVSGISRRHAILALGSAAVAVLVPARAQDGIPSQRVRFAKGTSAAALTGSLEGPASDVRDHVVGAKRGQQMQVELQTKSLDTYFNVLAPGSADPLFQGELAGENRWSGRLPADGDYRVRVYLNRAAARKRKASSYALKVAVTG